MLTITKYKPQIQICFSTFIICGVQKHQNGIKPIKSFWIQSFWFLQNHVINLLVKLENPQLLTMHKYDSTFGWSAGNYKCATFFVTCKHVYCYLFIAAHFSILLCGESCTSFKFLQYKEKKAAVTLLSMQTDFNSFSS